MFSAALTAAAAAAAASAAAAAAAAESCNKHWYLRQFKRSEGGFFCGRESLLSIARKDCLKGRPFNCTQTRWTTIS